jgi:hypothetical protein
MLNNPDYSQEMAAELLARAHWDSERVATLTTFGRSYGPS